MSDDGLLDVNDDMMNELDSCDPDEDDATMHEGLSRLFNVLEGEQCTSVHLAPRVNLADGLYDPCILRY